MVGRRAVTAAADPRAVAELVDAVEAELGPVDVLVANHGLARRQALEDVTLDDWDAHHAVNPRAPFLLAQRCAPGMRDRGFGRILFVSSVAALTGGIVGPHYAATKPGLYALTHFLAARLAGSGVTVNAICPALLEDTAMLPGDPGELAASIPVGRLGRPEEVAALALAILSNGYLTNQTISLDGGLHPRCGRGPCSHRDAPSGGCRQSVCGHPGAMRIFIAGATGAIGVPLVRRLVADGHRVAGMTRSETRTGALRELGAEPVICDVFDAAALTAAVVRFAPDAVIHELTDLPDNIVDIASRAGANNRIRREGTRNLLAAAREAGAHCFLAQSVAWPLPGDAGDAVEEHEHAVLDAGGVVLRYGRFYGPGTYHPDDVAEAPAVHVDEAARRTAEALDAPSGIVTVVDVPEGGPYR